MADNAQMPALGELTERARELAQSYELSGYQSWTIRRLVTEAYEQGRVDLAREQGLYAADPASGGNPGPGLSDAAVDAELEADAAEQRAAFAWAGHEIVPLPGSVRDRLDHAVPDELDEPLNFPVHALCSGCHELIQRGPIAGWAHIRGSVFASLDENRST